MFRSPRRGARQCRGNGRLPDTGTTDQRPLSVIATRTQADRSRVVISVQAGQPAGAVPQPALLIDEPVRDGVPGRPVPRHYRYRGLPGPASPPPATHPAPRPAHRGLAATIWWTREDESPAAVRWETGGHILLLHRPSPAQGRLWSSLRHYGRTTRCHAGGLISQRYG